MAGGKGTRLLPVTCGIPKPLAHIVNKPMLVHIIELLKKHGITDVILTTRYLADQIQEFFGDGSEYGVNISYSVEEKALGTAGGVKLVHDQLDDTFLVLSGDVLTDFDLTKLLDFHKKNKAAVTIGLTRVENPLEYGIVITDQNGRISRFLEKPGWSEVFSDTINTGTYVIEPRVFERLPEGKVRDFSKDLFPELLSDGEPMYGYVDDCYWHDVGNPEKFIVGAHDVLTGKVKAEVPGKAKEMGGESVWIGKDAIIEEGAIIRGPSVIGDNVIICKGAEVGPLASIGNNVTIGPDAQVSRSVVLGNARILEGAVLQRCCVCPGVNVGSGAIIEHDAVVGENTVVGRKSHIHSGIKLWPGKVVEPGAVVNMDVKVGVTWLQHLFGASGVTGSVNIEITPEFATRLGASIGTFLGSGTQVIIGRDTRLSTRMIKRALVAGLSSVGVTAMNVTVAPTPVIQYLVNAYAAKGGIAVTGGHKMGQVTIKVFGDNGRDIDEAEKRKIEDIFFKSDLKRAEPMNVGDVEFPARYLDRYRRNIKKHLDIESITKRRPRIVVDCAMGAGSVIAPLILQEIGCEVLSLNAQVGTVTQESRPTPEALSHLSKTVKALGADFGVAYDLDADKLMCVTDDGQIVMGDVLLALMAMCLLKKGEKMVVPVTASLVVEEAAQKAGAEIIRAKMSPAVLERTIIESGAVLGGDELGACIFPQFQLSRDGILLAAKLAEIVSGYDEPLSKLVEKVPVTNVLRDTVECPWEYRGRIMRTIMEMAEGKEIETLDGLKVWFDDGWVLIRPDGSRPVFHVISESKDKDTAKEYLNRYKSFIEDAKYDLDVEEGRAEEDEGSS